jgi:hypothetical protein
MKSRLFVVFALTAVLLSGCATAAPVSAPAPTAPATALVVASPTATAPAAPVPTPTATTPAVPAAINAADYLVEGKPHHPDSNGEWYGRWAFYTDATKDVFCDIFIFSGDGPAVHCYLTSKALDAQAAYTVPSSISSACGSSGSYGVALDAESLYPKLAGFIGCDPFIDQAKTAIQAKTKVLPDGAKLTVSPYFCTVSAGIATCTDTQESPHASLTFGLQAATFVQ